MDIHYVVPTTVNYPSIVRLIEEHGAGKVLPISEGLFLERLEREEILIALNGVVEPLAHVALSLYQHGEAKLVEVMSLVTHSNYRQHGIASELVRRAVAMAMKNHPDAQILCMASIFSHKLFLDLGFIDATLEEIQEFFGPLLDICPTECGNFKDLEKGQFCCHIPMIYKGKGGEQK